MRQGSTPTHRYTIPIPTDQITDIAITYQQNGQTKIEKGFADCTFEGYVVSVCLTQEDTFNLDAGCSVKIQIKFKTLDGNVIPLKPRLVSCGECLCKRVL